MTAATADRTVAKSLNTGAAEQRIQAAQQQAALKAIELHAMLEWYGSDIAAGQSPAGFKTAVASIRRWHELNEGEAK